MDERPTPKGGTELPAGWPCGTQPRPCGPSTDQAEGNCGGLIKAGRPHLTEPEAARDGCSEAQAALSWRHGWLAASEASWPRP
eukprot:8094868-Alexandrium_andersonii.AAC.1